MKKFVLLLATTMLLAACGNDVKTDPTGSWAATLTPTQTASQGSATAMAFTDTLTTSSSQSAANNISVSSVTAANLNITTNNGCLGNDADQLGQFAVNATTNGFILILKGVGTSATGNNVLTLTGTLSNNSISGTWTMGPEVPSSTPALACMGGGNFTMTLMAGNSAFPSRH